MSARMKNVCECGSHWFRIVADPEVDQDAYAGALAVDEDTGDICGWAGRMVCFECGSPRWAPAPEMRVL